MTDHDAQIDESLLPTQMRRLIRCIGLPETMALLKAKGGTPVRFPKQAGNSSQFDGILSPAAIDQLAAEFGGQLMELPKYDKIAQQLRNLAIRAARADHSATALAKQFQLTRRSIILICGTPTDNGQTSLFDLPRETL